MQSTQPKFLAKSNFWRIVFSEFWVRFGAIWFVVGMIFLSIGLMLMAGELRYRSDGITAEALITSKEHRGEDYRIDYRFDTANGRVDGSNQVPLETWNKLPVNGPVVVVYRAHNPSSNRAQGQDHWVLVAILTPLGAFFFVIGAILLVKSLHDLRKAIPDGS